MRRCIVLLLLSTLMVRTWGQTDPQLGHYMYLQTTYNPAAAGEGDLMRVAGMHRMSFVGIQDAPMTTYFAFSSPFKIGKTSHAAGVRFMNDMYGLFTNQSFHVQYAYRHKLGKGYLSVGCDLGFVNLGFAQDKVNLDSISQMEEDGYHRGTGEDMAIPKGQGSHGASGMGFDMGLGVYYGAPAWWAGVSYSHLNQPRLEFGDESEISLAGTLYIAGGYKWRLRNKNWVLRPSVMAMTDFASWDVNMTMLAEVKERFRFGVGYRVAGSVNILLGVDVVSGLQLGYTYELPANHLFKETFGSHEIHLAYGFDVLKPNRNNRYKSVRYL